MAIESHPMKKDAYPHQPLITVIVLTYNHEKWIRACLDSILSQKDIEFEVIVHDDNSSDSTPHILENYGDRCTVIRNLTGINIGISASINNLLKIASGRYVAMMSGDDIWIDGKLRKQFDLMETERHIDFCFTGAICIDADGKHHSGPSPFITQNMDRLEWIRKIFFQNFLPAASVLIRNDSWLRSNPFNPALRQLQDWEYWIRALCAGKFFYIIPEMLTCYRVVEGSVSNSSTSQKASREYFEFIHCLKAFRGLSLGEFRSIFGRYVEREDIFVRDRSVNTGLAILMSLVGARAYSWAAAEILREHFISLDSNISDHEYHEFIGRLGLHAAPSPK
jgi:glycosyltransferase involved in cell wall biosynthesis